MASSPWKKTKERPTPPAPDSAPSSSSSSSSSSSLSKIIEMENSTSSCDSQCWKVQKMKSTKVISEDKQTPLVNKIHRICIALNKMTAHNYEVHRTAIVAEIRAEEEEEEEEEEGRALANLGVIFKKVFAIVSQNKSNAQVYARLCVDLFCSLRSPSTTQLPFLEYVLAFEQSIFGVEERVNGELVVPGRSEINYVDPNIDYDGYCVYVKKNDMRKSAALFILHVFKLERQAASVSATTTLMCDTKILNTMQRLQEVLAAYISQEAKTYEVEEIQEVFFLYVTETYPELHEHALWRDDIFPKLVEFGSFKAKNFASLTSRAVFKCLDMLDFIAKRRKGE